MTARLTGILLALATAIMGALPANAATISDLRIALELTDGAVFTRELIALKGDATPSRPEPLTLPLPRGAVNPTLAEGQEMEGLALRGNDVVVTGPIPAEGRTVAVMFVLPIVEGEAVLDQRFGRPVPLAHAAFIGEIESIHLAGPGFGSAQQDRIPSGLPALFTVGQGFDDGHIRLAVSGFDGDRRVLISKLATLLSFGILAFGFVIWLKRRRSA